MTNMSGSGLKVNKRVRVQVSIERAFSFFVENMGVWWPASHHIGKSPFEAIFIEPRVGGRWYERNEAGEECTWGTVLAWDPPHRVTLSWHLGPGHDRPEWVFDPDMNRASEVEVRFHSDGLNATVVELEHSKLERHGEGAVQLRELFDGPDAWQGILGHYVDNLAADDSRKAQS